MFIEKYPLQVSSVIIAPIAQKFYFPKALKLPFPNLKGMYHLAEYFNIPKTSIRVTLSRMKKKGEIDCFTDKEGIVRYKMTKMMTLISKHALLFGKSKGFTLAVFNFKKENDKERYRIREILNAFGFRKLAQNVYLNIRVDSENIMQEIAKWDLEDNIYLFNCNDIKDPSMISRIRLLWKLDQWNDKLNEFYEDLKIYFSFDDLSDEEVYKRYSYGYSVFFVYFYEKHPLVPSGFMKEDYALVKVMELLQYTLDNYTDNIAKHYKLINS
ncbi:hypothetical protein [Clostridium sp.]|jgi:DNA-binding transcriptional regulator PaaX|uniref:hypothetical protein n=1 Tax=Clostridium sp. TaxID=1506 RepID=UPI0025883D41|nr:hypothetical protein [Clostridium sp.]MDF2504109.1 hypothetical protein [Clostridium sp.]